MKSILLLFIICAFIYECELKQRDNTNPVIEFENLRTDDGYHFRYKTDNSERTETGVFDHLEGEENGKFVITGFYNYIGTDGNTYQVDYEADENGYRPHVYILTGSRGVQQPPENVLIEPIIGSATLASLTGGGIG